MIAAPGAPSPIPLCINETNTSFPGLKHLLLAVEPNEKTHDKQALSSCSAACLRSQRHTSG